MRESRYPSTLRLEEGSELIYLLRTPASPETADLSITLALRAPRKTGGWKTPHVLRMQRAQIAALPNGEDRELVAMLGGGANDYGAYEIPSPCVVPAPLAQILIPRILGSGRCYRSDASGKVEDTPLGWDDGPAWELTVELREGPEGGFSMDGSFRRNSEHMDLARVLHVYKSGFVLTLTTLAPAATGTSQRWANVLRRNRRIAIPEDQLPAFLDRMFGGSDTPRLELPPSLGLEDASQPPRPLLKIERVRQGEGSEWFRAKLLFDYGGRVFVKEDTASGFFDASTRSWLRRDRAAESAAQALLESLGAVRAAEEWQQPEGWNFSAQRLPVIVTGLLAAGWRVTAEGKDFRRPGTMRAEVSSGVDWFDLKCAVDYGENSTAQLPELLAALERGEKMIELGDGSYGLIPVEWLLRFAAVGTMGRVEGDGIRFAPAQAGLLDALLAAQPAIDCDVAFARI